MSRDTAQLLRRLRRQGIRVRRTGCGRWKATGPTGLVAVFAATPSGRRSIANARARLRRIGAQL